jgi:hypothetical protein
MRTTPPTHATSLASQWSEVGITAVNAVRELSVPKTMTVASSHRVAVIRRL